MKYISPNSREVISAYDPIIEEQFYVEGTSSNGAINVNISGSVVTGDINLVEVGGSPIALGQAAMANSLPVVISSDQSAVPVSIQSGGITNYALETGGNLQDIANNQTNGTQLTQIVDSGGTAADVTAANALKVDGSAVTQPVLIPLPGTLVSFVTTIPTAGTRVQLASNSLSQGIVIEAPSTNTGVIYIGGSTVSSSVFGGELQPGQSVGLAVNNTNLVYADTATNGNRVAVLGA